MDTQQTQEQIDTDKCAIQCSCPWEPRPQEGYPSIQTGESFMGLHECSLTGILSFFFYLRNLQLLKKDAADVSTNRPENEGTVSLSTEMTL